MGWMDAYHGPDCEVGMADSTCFLKNESEEGLRSQAGVWDIGNFA